jgi:hypothetical protein
MTNAPKKPRTKKTAPTEDPPQAIRKLRTAVAQERKVGRLETSWKRARKTATEAHAEYEKAVITLRGMISDAPQGELEFEKGVRSKDQIDAAIEKANSA